MEGQLERRIERHEIGDYLVADPEICHGRLTFKGTRIPVSTVLTFLGMGDSIDEILEDWPQLSREAVLEALRLAADVVSDCYPKLHSPLCTPRPSASTDTEPASATLQIA